MADVRERIKEGQSRWKDGIDAQSEDVDKEEINEFIQYKHLEYEAYKMMDDDLWEVYRDDFSTFTTQTFKDCNQTTIRNFRQFLRVHGVWVKKHRYTTVAESLFNTLQEEEPMEWTESEIRDHMATGGEFKSGRITYMLNNGKFPGLPGTVALATPTPTQSPGPSRTTVLTPGPAATSHTALGDPQEPLQTQSFSREPTQSLSRELNQSLGKELANIPKIYTDDNK
jgi:hypothetical protein